MTFGASGTPVLEWGLEREQAQVAVLTLHGRAQDPGFMRDTAGRFGAVPARFYAPEAAGNTWYPRPFLAPVEDNRPELDAAFDVLEGCLDRLAGEGFTRERVVLWGFSQGACVLSHYVLTTAPGRFGGMILFTGGYLGPDPLPPPEGEPLSGVRTVLRSIDQDPWVPRSRVEETAAVLSRAGAPVDLRIDPGEEHVITDEACAAATGLLNAANEEEARS